MRYEIITPREYDDDDDGACANGMTSMTAKLCLVYKCGKTASVIFTVHGTTR